MSETTMNTPSCFTGSNDSGEFKTFLLTHGVPQQLQSNLSMIYNSIGRKKKQNFYNYIVANMVQSRDQQNYLQFQNEVQRWSNDLSNNLTQSMYDVLKRATKNTNDILQKFYNFAVQDMTQEVALLSTTEVKAQPKIQNGMSDEQMEEEQVAIQQMKRNIEKVDE
jgi:uncharacterized radical SAM superfamily protein